MLGLPARRRRFPCLPPRGQPACSPAWSKACAPPPLCSHLLRIRQLDHRLSLAGVLERARLHHGGRGSLVVATATPAAPASKAAAPTAKAASPASKPTTAACNRDDGIDTSSNPGPRRQYVPPRSWATPGRRTVPGEVGRSVSVPIAETGEHAWIPKPLTSSSKTAPTPRGCPHCSGVSRVAARL